LAITLGENRYGKSRVRLVRVKRRREKHEVREWSLEILLQGDFETCFTEGDNSRILPTDTMKNTVYSLARKSSVASMEEFAKELVDFLLERNPQVSHAEVSASEKHWEHAMPGGKPHPTTFVQSSGERQTTKVEREQKGKFSVVSGLENLVIMKTAGSGFEGYIQDSLTTLAPASDRLFATALKANWTYCSPEGAFEKLRTRVREILISVFAEHGSKSVQHTLYAMGEAVLEGVAEVKDIELTMPNIHCLLVDLSRFGQDNPNEIFVPTDEPQGYIEARVCRKA
jgi:urate oxidase